MGRINYANMNIDYGFRWNGMDIYDSFKVPHRHFHNVLNRIRAESPNANIWTMRSYWSMECEWACHNMAYRLGINREKAQSVFLNNVLSRKEKLFYHIVGSLLYIWK